MTPQDTSLTQIPQSLSIDNDPRNVAPGMEPHSSTGLFSPGANFVAALQQVSEANPLTEDPVHQYINPRHLTMVGPDGSISGGVERTTISRDARYAPYTQAPPSTAYTSTSAFSVLSTLYSTVIGGTSQPPSIPGPSTNVPAPHVTTIAQASHYSGNPAAFKLFRTLLGHYVMTQMIFLGHIILQDKRAGIKAQVSTLASIMTTLLVTRNLRSFNITPLTGDDVTSAINTGRKMLMEKAVSFVNTILVIPNPGFGDNNASKTYINYVHGITAGVTAGSFFHLPQDTAGPRMFRNKQFWYHLITAFYRSDNRCLAAKFPRAFTRGITIEVIAAFSTAIVHRIDYLEAQKLGESLPKFKSETYESIYNKFLGQLQLELLAETNFQAFIDEQSSFGLTLLPLAGPTVVIH